MDNKKNIYKIVSWWEAKFTDYFYHWLYNLELYKNWKLLYNIDDFLVSERREALMNYILEFNNDDIYIVLHDRDFERFNIINILKNWKPLCDWIENQENPNEKENTTPINSKNIGSAVNPASLKLPEDNRVSSESSLNTNKIETKDKKDEEIKNKDKSSENLSKNQKNEIKNRVKNIINKYERKTLDKLYKALTTRDDIKKKAEKNEKIKFIIKEFENQYFDLVVKLK